MQKLLVAALVVIVLGVGAAVPALAMNTQAWEERRIATEAFDAAADLARDASESAAAAHARLDEARDAAGSVLDDARAVAAAAPGYLTGTLVAELQTTVTTLEEALAAEAPDGLAMPDMDRPESVADLTVAVAPLTEWATAEDARAEAVGVVVDALSDATSAATDAALAAAESVTPEAAAALGGAPLATPESRAAVEAARDAVLAAIETDETLGDPVSAYASAVAALRASQQAAADAAAAANSGAGDSNDFALDFLLDIFGYDPSDCVPFDGGWACGGLP